jgi:hypothetical protein
MQVSGLGIVASWAAAASRPVLWLVGIGMVFFMWLRPGTRANAREQVARWGGWLEVPRAAWRWAGTGLREWPFAVVAVAGFVVIPPVLISWSLSYVPWMLALSLIIAMVLPTFVREIDVLARWHHRHSEGHDPD